MAEDKEFGIEWGETTYTNEASEFMWTSGREVANGYAEKSLHPSSINEALLLRAKRQLINQGDYSNAVINKLGDWKKSSPVQIDEAVLATLNEESWWPKQIAERTAVFEKVTEIVDHNDKSNIQLAIIKKKEGNSEHDYAYLFVYPPDPDTGLRQVEVSFPTALCHLIDASVLLKNSKPVEVSGTLYDVCLNKAKPMSDADLSKVVSEVGRTPLDMVVQGGLKVIDKVRKTQGQHIDPISAWTNMDYAIQYAVATHRGVGMVSNEKMILPPVKF